MASKELNYNSIEFAGIDMRDWPDFCDAYVQYAEWSDGTPLTEEEMDDLLDENDGVRQMLEEEAAGG